MSEYKYGESQYEGLLDSLVGSNHDPDLRRFAVKCLQSRDCEIATLRAELTAMTKAKDLWAAESIKFSAELDAERAKSACMRLTLAESGWKRCGCPGHWRAHGISCAIGKALSTDAGTALLSRLREAEAKCERYEKALKLITIQACDNGHPDDCVCCLEESSVKDIAEEALTPPTDALKEGKE